MKRAILALSIVIGLGVVLSSETRAQDASGTIRGVVFEDINGDGVRDPGEPGLSARDVSLEAGGRDTTNEAGRYSFEVGVGDVTVSTEPDQMRGICVDTAFSFHPLAAGWCVNVTNHWHPTTPSSVSVAVVSGQTYEVDFGLRPYDDVMVAGRVLVEDGRAPAGTAVEAVVRGEACGSATTTNDELPLRMEVLGAGERPGCASPGDEVSFIVGGVHVPETVTWKPFTQITTFGSYLAVDLIAMQDHAWYWWQSSGDYSAHEGATVEAFIDGKMCGETILELGGGIEGSSPDVRIGGFSKLLVPSETIEPGCGRVGVTVTLRLGDALLTTLPWRAGLQPIDPDLLLPKLPDTGSAGIGSGGRAFERSFVALAVLGLTLFAVGGLMARGVLPCGRGRS